MKTLKFLNKEYKVSRKEFWDKIPSSFQEEEQIKETVIVSDKLLEFVSNSVSKYLGESYLTCRPVLGFYGYSKFEENKWYENDDEDDDGDDGYCLRFGFEKPEPERLDYVRGDKIIGYVYIDKRKIDLIEYAYIDKRKTVPIETEASVSDIFHDITPKLIVDENRACYEKYYKKYPFIGNDIYLVATIDPDTDLPTILLQKTDYRNEVCVNKEHELLTDPKTGLYYEGTNECYFKSTYFLHKKHPVIPMINPPLDEKFENVKKFTERISKMGANCSYLLELKENEDLNQQAPISNFLRYNFRDLGLIYNPRLIDISYNMICKKRGLIVGSEFTILNELQSISSTELHLNVMDNHVIGLRLNNGNLIAIPDCIWNLRYLESLELSNNTLTSLPEDFSKLDKLTYLSLDNNILISIPESIGNLNSLESLSLSHNKLTALPESIGNLTKLRYLELDNNYLTSLPDTMGQLVSLHSLSLSHNKLTALPESIGHLNILEELKADDNCLTSLPESIGHLNILYELEVDDNCLTSLPESIGRLLYLHNLSLSHNKLTTLPESIGNLVRLTDLNLGNNCLTLLPEKLGYLRNLLSLQLEKNQIKSLPNSIGHLTSLTLFKLSDNLLTSLPESIGNMRKLRLLEISGNPLTSIPEGIAKIIELLKKEEL